MDHAEDDSRRAGDRQDEAREGRLSWRLKHRKGRESVQLWRDESGWCWLWGNSTSRCHPTVADSIEDVIKVIKAILEVDEVQDDGPVSA